MADESAEQGRRGYGRRTSVPCPKCGWLKSVSAGNDANSFRVWRRRQCVNCEERFSTYEIRAESYKNLKRVVSIEAQAAYKELAAAKRVAEVEKVLADLEIKKAALTRVIQLVSAEEEETKRQREWQRENPTEALKAILPPAVFEYLNDWARRDGVSLTDLIKRQIALDVEIDLDFRRDEGDYVDHWLKKLEADAVVPAPAIP